MERRVFTACVLWAVPFMILSACIRETPTQSESQGPSNTCSSASDCTGGAACDTEIGLCKSSSPRVSEVLVDILPSMEEVPRRIRTAVLASGNTRLTVERVRRLGGRLWTNHPVPTAVAADVRFMPRLESGATPYRQSITIRSEDAFEPGGDNFTIELPAGTYDVEIWPTESASDRSPPTYTTVTIAQDTRRIDIETPAPSPGLGSLYLGNNPIEGALIWAEDGLGRRVSTTDVSGSCPAGRDLPDAGADAALCGTFDIRVAPVAPPIFLHIELPDIPFFPEYTIGVELTLQDASTPDPLDIRLPPVGVPSIFSAEVQSFDDQRRIIGVEDVSVLFRGNDIGGGSLIRETITDANGRFHEEVIGWLDAGAGVYLLRGEYEVMLIPPVGSPYACTRSDGPVVIFSEGDVQEGQVFVLPRKIALAGRAVAGEDQEPFPSVLLRALPRGGSDSPQRSALAMTSASGGFDLTVDPGRYVLVAEPPAASGFACAWAEVEAAAGSPTAVIAFGPPFLWKGRIVYDDGEPVVNAAIAVALPTETLGTPIPVARAQTDEDGDFIVLLPGQN